MVCAVQESGMGGLGLAGALRVVPGNIKGSEGSRLTAEDSAGVNLGANAPAAGGSIGKSSVCRIIYMDFGTYYGQH